MNDIVLPTPERARRGIERLEHAIADCDDRPAQPYRSIDILAAMHKRGAITKEMVIAGERFRADFAVAHLDPLKAADVSRPMVSGRMKTAILAGRIEDARESIWHALVAVGGVSSLGGSCLWHVLGWQGSLKSWAVEQGWNGRRVSQDGAACVLMTALGTLAAHYENSP